jgi:hypothetical protein
MAGKMPPVPKKGTPPPKPAGRKQIPADIGLTSPMPGMPMDQMPPAAPASAPGGFATRPPAGLRPSGKQTKSKGKRK